MEEGRVLACVLRHTSSVLTCFEHSLKSGLECFDTFFELWCNNVFRTFFEECFRVF